MSDKKLKYLSALIGCIVLTIFVACSTQKNTVITRAYHSVNTRYNVHFNANEAYNQAMKDKIEGRNENLSEML